MKARKPLILFLIILFTVLQCTAFNYIRIFKTKPDILLLLIIFFSLYYGWIYGLMVGALCGLFSELSSGIPSGFAVLTYSLGGLILGHIGRWLVDLKIFSQMAISFIFVLVIYTFLILLFQISNARLSLSDTLMFIILPASFYTACVSPFIFHFLKIVLNVK